MKKIITLVFVLSTFISNAKRAVFGSQNNYVTRVAPVAPFQAPAIITNGLVFNLDAADPSSYSGSGNVWNTLVGTNHINFYTSNSYSTGGNPTYSTDGGGSLVTSGLWGRSIANSGISGAAPRSFEGWVKFDRIPSATSGSGNSIIYIGEMSTQRIFEMMAYQTNLISHAYNVKYTKSSTVLETSKWYQAVITYDGSTNHVIYINGVQVGASSANDQNNWILNTGNTPIYIGTGLGTNWGPFDGKISMLRMYNRALSSSDVVFNFNALKSRFGL